MNDNSCIKIDYKEYTDDKIRSLEQKFQLELKAVHAEYQKSEGNYPTREQLDQAMKGYCTTVEAARLGRNLEILMGVVISIFLLFVGAFLKFGG